MLRRNGPVIKPWSQSWGQEGSLWRERFVKEVGLEPAVKDREGVMDGESGELTGNWAVITSSQSNFTKGRITAAHGRCSLYFTMGGHSPSPKNGPFPWGSWNPIPWDHPCPWPKWHLDQFRRLCRAHAGDRQTEKQTDRPTDRPRYSVCNKTPHLRTQYCDAVVWRRAAKKLKMLLCRYSISM